MNKHLLKEVNELCPEKSNKLIDFIFFEMIKKKSVMRQFGDALLAMNASTTLLVKHKYVTLAFYDDDLMLVYNPNTNDRFKKTHKYNDLNDIEFNIVRKKALFGYFFVIKWIYNNNEYSAQFHPTKSDTTFGKKSNRIGVKVQEIFNKLLEKYSA
mgnify:CR=1 FL=1|tara:strand:+ start:43 stop:507 length:465 start_codon:yes stop_codon:yes gene_type:complete